MKNSYQRIGIIVKPNNEVIPYLKQLVDILKKKNKQLILDKISAKMLSEKKWVDRKDIGKKCDILILIGGDGTFLSVAKQAVLHDIPVAGFNLGSLGFLTELTKDSIEQSIKNILGNKQRISKRKVLRIKFKNKNYLALNDIVIAKGNIARMIMMDLKINGEKIATIKADGMIISTPTGSTAYSLSAGGPIVSPKVNGIVITPICPHSLTFRPLVISSDSNVKLKLSSDSDDVWVTIDGQNVLKIVKDQSFNVTVDKRELNMIVSERIGYFQLIHEKLNWGA